MVYLSQEPYENLRDYIEVYLNEEIQREANVRNIPNFSRFLTVAALSSGNLVNFSKMGADAQVHPNSVREYFKILIDTLLGFTVEPWRKSKTRKSVETVKFYLFDCGVTHAIGKMKQIFPKTEEYGRALEQLVAHEIKAYLSYTRSTEELAFWRTLDKKEVDFILGDKIALEVKAAEKVSERDHKGLLALKEEKLLKKYYLVSLDPKPARFESGIEHLPFLDFIQKLWAGDFI